MSVSQLKQDIAWLLKNIERARAKKNYAAAAAYAKKRAALQRKLKLLQLRGRPVRYRRPVLSNSTTYVVR